MVKQWKMKWKQVLEISQKDDTKTIIEQQSELTFKEIHKSYENENHMKINGIHFGRMKFL